MLINSELISQVSRCQLPGNGMFLCWDFKEERSKRISADKYRRRLNKVDSPSTVNTPSSAVEGARAGTTCVFLISIFKQAPVDSVN